MGDTVVWGLASIPLTCVGLVVLVTLIPGLADKQLELFTNHPVVRNGWFVVMIICVLAICTLLVGSCLTSDSRNSNGDPGGGYHRRDRY